MGPILGQAEATSHAGASFWTQKMIQVPTCSSSITLLHIDSKLRHASGFSALCDLLLQVLYVDEETSIGTMDFGCSQTVGKHMVTINRLVASSQNGNLLSKTIASKNCYKRASYGNFQQKKRPSFQDSLNSASNPSKNCLPIQKIDQLAAFCMNQLQFFINFIPNTHSKEYAHLKRVRIYLTYLDLFFTC